MGGPRTRPLAGFARTHPRAWQMSKKPSIFSFTPPIGCTRPYWFTEPVMASDWRIGTAASAESSAHNSASEALSPSTGP